MIPPRSNFDLDPQQVRSRAPMNSVSTRIILCVFFSTMLTALVVSWLSIGAIHNDVRSRVEHKTRTLAEERRSEIALWHSAASTQLAASTAIGTPWQTRVLSSLARLEGCVALEEVLQRWPEWEIDQDEAEMARTSTVRGWKRLPAQIQ